MITAAFAVLAICEDLPILSTTVYRSPIRARNLAEDLAKADGLTIKWEVNQLSHEPNNPIWTGKTQNPNIFYEIHFLEISN